MKLEHCSAAIRRIAAKVATSECDPVKVAFSVLNQAWLRKTVVSLREVVQYGFRPGRINLEHRVRVNAVKVSRLVDHD